MKTIAKPYFILLLLAVFTFLISLITAERSVQFTAFDTYYVITQNLILKIFGIKLLLYSSFYRFLSQFLYSKWLTWLHILLTVLLFIFLSWYNEQATKSLALIELGDNSFEYFANINQQLFHIFSVYIAVQVLPIINLLAGLMKMNFKKNTRAINVER